MIRKIIKINEEKCSGCGICAEACHEGAIEIVGGKAKLLRENYCDGLGDCLPSCPTGAISFEEREAPAYDEKAVNDAKAAKKKAAVFSGCPGSAAKKFSPDLSENGTLSQNPSRLSQWPVQIKLAAPNSPFFDGADLLIAADCTAYAYGNFHNDFIMGKVCIIGCPKLDMVDYTEKLTAIISNNDVKSVTIARMEVPCCGGLEKAVKNAIINSGKNVPCKTVTISTDGKIL
ncbi:MAG: 4Fe-4S binding protein [Eubacterium sp.]|nr:4Fe-4S binding protein [Eubacterium sp.]